MSGRVLTRRVIVFFGLTASGKSHLSGAWARRHNLKRFNTDVVRKGLAPLAETTGLGIGQGIYGQDFTRKTYDRLLDLAEETLAGGAVQVVLDGSYLLAEERLRLIRRFARRADSYFILCWCSEEMTRQRLELRAREKDAVSDGTLEIYRHQQTIFVRPGESAEDRLLKLDTDAPLEDLMDRLDQFLSA